MNADILKQAGIDYDRGVQRFMGRANVYEKVLSKFSRDRTFERIRAARAAGDDAQLLANVHEFKGMCGNVSLTPLYEAAVVLLGLLRDGAASPSARDAAYVLLEKEYDRIGKAICAATEASI